MRVIQIMEWTNAGFYGRSFFGSCYRYFNDLPDALATWYFTHTPNIVWVFASNVVACYLHKMYNTLCIHFMHSTFRICHLFIRNQFILTEKQFMIKWSRTSSSKEIFEWHTKILSICMSNFLSSSEWTLWICFSTRLFLWRFFTNFMNFVHMKSFVGVLYRQLLKSPAGPLSSEWKSCSDVLKQQCRVTAD